MQPLGWTSPKNPHSRPRTGTDRHLRFGLMLLVLLHLLILAPFPGLCTEPDIDFSLPVPASEAHRSYLGLSQDNTADKTGTNTFRLGQIRADLVLVEIFSMYCPICQREAKNVNQLYELIQADERLKHRVKMIGIGAGNTAFEVNFFKETYNIAFPLFSDGNFSIHKKIGEKGTPYFIGLKKGNNNVPDIVFTWSGEIPDPRQFLDELLKKAGMTP